MTDWSSLKVAELKEECKNRKISITGLKLKQQYIDKLTEAESESGSHAQEIREAPADAPVEEPESVAETTNGASEEAGKNEEEPGKQLQRSDAENQDETTAERTNGAIEDAPKEDAPVSDQPESNEGQQDEPQMMEIEESQEEQTTPPTLPGVIATNTDLPSSRPTLLKAEDTQLRPDNEAGAEDDNSTLDSAQGAGVLMINGMLIPEPQQPQVEQDVPNQEQDMDVDSEQKAAEEKLKLEAHPEQTKIVDSIDPNTDTPSSIPSEDIRKRKRRSLTPPPNAEEVAKKAKIDHNKSFVTKRSSRSPTPGSTATKRLSTPEIQAAWAAGNKGSEDEPTKDQLISRDQTVDGEEDQEHHHHDRSPSIDKDSTVEPALHAATRSLYMRNFKRPLNIQTLRSHILATAQSSSAADSPEDPIKLYSVNNIRSHVFVQFSTVSAASRVRAAMHGTRFPDEPQRDPLFIDFVPDEKIEDWVEQERGGTKELGRNRSANLEVVYKDTGEGYEAVFQEVNAGQRSSLSMAGPQRSSVSASQQRQPSYSADPTATIASGIHPDRAPLVPRSPTASRRKESIPVPVPQRPQRESDAGIGFKGLDDLFESTTTKPKLYYKLPPQALVDERLDMIKDLYSDRGVSGDPGMKRYTFEKDRGREDWVDNGPEFGHGKRGMDRLAGIGGRGRGGFRGRGGGRGGFYAGGDSYRGGGRR